MADTLEVATSLDLTTSAFQADAPIPEQFTCDGDDVSPPLSWQGVPDGAESLALIVDDPDAPEKTFVHWVLFNIPADRDMLEEDLDIEGHFEDKTLMPIEGVNDFGNQGYGGPCPPPGHGTHHYSFRLYALDTDLDLSAGATKKQLTQAMDGHVLAEGNLVGTYERG